MIDDDETGLLVPVDEAALGAALGQLADDHELARRLGRNAREVALERFSADRMVDAYLALYATSRGRSS